MIQILASNISEYVSLREPRREGQFFMTSLPISQWTETAWICDEK